MEQPRDLEFLKKRMIGEWKVEATVRMPDQSPLKIEGTARIEAISIGQGLYTDLRVHIDPVGPYEVHVLWHYDQREQKVHCYGISSLGAVHSCVGRWIDDNTLKYTWKGQHERKSVMADVTFTWASPDVITAHATSSLAEHPGPEVNAVARRQPG